MMCGRSEHLPLAVWHSSGGASWFPEDPQTLPPSGHLRNVALTRKHQGVGNIRDNTCRAHSSGLPLFLTRLSPLMLTFRESQETSPNLHPQIHFDPLGIACTPSGWDNLHSHNQHLGWSLTKYRLQSPARISHVHYKLLADWDGRSSLH